MLCYAMLCYARRARAGRTLWWRQSRGPGAEPARAARAACVPAAVLAGCYPRRSCCKYCVCACYAMLCWLPPRVNASIAQRPPLFLTCQVDARSFGRDQAERHHRELGAGAEPNTATLTVHSPPHTHRPLLHSALLCSQPSSVHSAPRSGTPSPQQRTARLRR